MATGHESTMRFVTQLVVILGALLAGLGYIARQYDALGDDLHLIDLRLIAIENSMVDRWTGQDMQLWVSDLHRKNPSLEVSDPIDIVRKRARPMP